jgi:hypothetical protein
MQPKTHMIRVRVTDAERGEFVAAAVLGQQSLSEWLRAVAAAAAERAQAEARAASAARLASTVRARVLKRKGA